MLNGATNTTLKVKMLDAIPLKDYDICNETLRMFLFEIHSTPRPQKQTQLGRGHWYDPSKMTKKQIQWQIAPHAPKEPLSGALEMHIAFYMPIPKNARGLQRQAMSHNVVKHYKRPDIDNLAYIVTNALKGIVYKDDSQICRLVLDKLYGEQPKTVIKVMEV